MLVQGDCLETLAGLPEDSVDAIVTDPPYGISFMGKEWDGPAKMLGQMATGKEQRGAFAYGGTHSRGYADNDNAKFQVWCESWAREALRVLKPGGHLLAFGGTRTYHRLTAGIEDAGFEIRDCVIYCYGSGFPKSLNVSKAIDKAAGAERKVIGHTDPHDPRTAMARGMYGNELQEGAGQGTPITEAATAEAKEWEGWGTALKPSYEPIVLARKPLLGTVVETVLEHGTGAINIDGCRIEHRSEADRAAATPGGRVTSNGSAGAAPDVDDLGRREVERPDTSKGRWPANLVLDEEAGALMDEQSGEAGAGGPASGPTYSGHHKSGSMAGAFKGTDAEPVFYGDKGGASRFFYCAKASSREKNAGLGDDFEVRRPDARDEVAAGHFHEKGIQPQKNAHPTVKPIDLMRWLCRLITPPGGTVLDPFTGSGTTGIAAHLEGFEFIGIEREPEYLRIAEARLEWWSQRSGDTAAILGEVSRKREPASDPSSPTLFD